MKQKHPQNGIVAIVPVRAGSKGLPGKNTMPIDGLPLYLRAVKQGQRTIGQVLLSTDIDGIAVDALPQGCVLCKRPPHLATDDVPMAAVIHHLIQERSLQDTTIVLLQATSPLRRDADITAALALFQSNSYDMVLTVVERDRSVLKYGTIRDNEFTALRDQRYCFLNRQQLPAVHGPNGAVYVFSANRFIAASGFPHDSIGAIEMPAEYSIDIDSIEDLRKAEKVLHECMNAPID